MIEAYSKGIMSMNLAEYVSRHRSVLMALAIAFVVIYHYKCWVGGFPWYIGMVLQWGFIGVDIFFLLSGFGLTYSFQKNSISRFYKNRLIKILPCYLLMGAILVLHMFALGKELTGGEVLWMYSTLDYTFSHGGVDWYVSAILQLYLLFPILYYLVKWLRSWSCFLIVILVCTITWNYSLHWSHLAMLQRLPMFICGIYLAMYRGCIRQHLYIVFFYLLFFIGMLFCRHIISVNFLLTTLITPFFICLLSLTNDISEKLKINSCFTDLYDRMGGVLGSNTLHIYYGTNLALLSYDYISVGCGVKTIIFLLALVFGSYLFYWITAKAEIFFKI